MIQSIKNLGGMVHDILMFMESERRLAKLERAARAKGINKLTMPSYEESEVTNG